MKKVKMGKLDLRVTEFCFGVLPMGPLQANVPIDSGAYLIQKAWENGVNFFDTAEIYQTYPYLYRALKNIPEAVIATKSTATTYEGMEKSIKKAQRELGRTSLDIFHLHAARSTPTVFEERKGAYECLKEYRKKGVIRAIGISTHAVDVVERAAEEPDIDIIFPIINIDGMGIIRGTTNTMMKAIHKAHQNGKGIYAMKVLAGGHSINRIFDAIEFVRNIREISSCAIGIVREVELDFHLRLFNQQTISQELIHQCLDRKQKKLIILNLCRKCRQCIETCPSGALTMGADRPSINQEKCLTCGYCIPVCPEFNLRFA